MLDKQHESFVAAVRKCEMLWHHLNTCNEGVSGSFTLQSCKTTEKKCPKMCTARAELLFC